MSLTPYAASRGKGASLPTQTVLHQNMIKGAFPGPSFPLKAAGQGKLGSAWAEMLTSP